MEYRVIIRAEQAAAFQHLLASLRDLGVVEEFQVAAPSMSPSEPLPQKAAQDEKSFDLARHYRDLVD